MITLEILHHKKNEIQEVEFFKDKECTEAFDFTNAKNLYIQPVNGDISPLTALNDDVRHYAKIYIPYIPANQKPLPDNVLTLDDITPNLSKYIPEDNAVLFLSEEDCNKYDHNNNCKFRIICQDGVMPKSWKLLADKSCEITIFLPHGTQSEIQKAKEVAKELRGKYGVEKVNLFVLHCFTDVNDHPNPYALGIYDKREEYKIFIEKRCEASRKTKWYNGIETEKQWCELNIELAKEREKMGHINKVITTNSTGILPVQDKERLQVIDCKEIFEGYLNETI